MKIGIDTRLQNETGVGRYIRNLMHWLPIVDKKNDYVFIEPDVSWHSFEEQVKMPAIIKQHNIDLYHVPYFNVPIWHRGSFVVTIHDLIINEFDTGRASTRNLLVYQFKRAMYSHITGHAIRKSRAILVPSQATKDMIKKHFPHVDENKIHRTYEGVDLKIRHQTSDFRNLKIRNALSCSYFLYVGNAYPHKNVEFLIRSFSQIKDKDLKLVMVGSMNYFYHRVLELVKKLKLESRVVLTGEISDSELAWLYTHAKALVLPSLMEGFGLPAVEAMKLKCPVIVSNIPAFREICQDAAYYFYPRDESSLVSLLNQPNLKKKITHGTNRAADFSWKQMAKETVKVYEHSTRL